MERVVFQAGEELRWGTFEPADLRRMEHVLFHRDWTGAEDAGQNSVTPGQNSVTLVKVQPSMRTAGTTTPPRNPLSVLRSRATATVPAIASR